LGTNWNNTGVEDVTVEDDDLPWLVQDHSDTEAFANKSFSFSIEFDDNVGPLGASVDYWFGTTQTNVQNLPLSKLGNNYEGGKKMPNSLEPLNYIFNFTDTSNNHNFTTAVQIDIQDDTDPIKVRGSGDIDTTTGESFKLFAKFTDNIDIGLVEVYYMKETSSTWQSYEITSGSNNYYRVTNDDLAINTSNSIIKWKYYFYAEDISQNIATHGSESNPYIISVDDNDDPTADAGKDIQGDIGETINFDGSGSSDNIGIDSYTWTFNYEDEIKTLSGVEPPGFKFDIFGEYLVTLEIEDAAGNSDTDTLIVTIGALQKPDVTLVSPLDGDTIAETFVTLTWSTSHPNADLVKYTLYFGTDPDPPEYEQNIDDTEYEVDNLVNGGKYYWTVKPKLGDNLIGDKAPVISFTINISIIEYGLELSADKTSVTIVVGNDEIITLTVRNTGTISDSVKLEANKGDFPGDLTLEHDEIILTAKQTMNVELTIKTIKTTPIGNYTITITGVSTGDDSIEKSSSIEIQTIPEPDELDSDNDGLPDEWEMKWWNNLNQKGTDDPDSDGKTNLEEYLAGTDPTKAPTTEDTDNDGLLDSWEMKWWNNLDQRADDDPDGDGKTNIQEYNEGTDPTKKEKDEDGKKEADNTMAIAAGAGIVIVIVVLLLLFLMMKKKGGKPEPEKPEPAIAPAPVKGPTAPIKPTIPTKPTQPLGQPKPTTPTSPTPSPPISPSPPPGGVKPPVAGGPSAVTPKPQQKPPQTPIGK
jgi:hypothetical protein